jgi:hypothetical protein
MSEKWKVSDCWECEEVYETPAKCKRFVMSGPNNIAHGQCPYRTIATQAKQIEELVKVIIETRPKIEAEVGRLFDETNKEFVDEVTALMEKADKDVKEKSAKIEELVKREKELVEAIQWAIGALKTFWQFEPETGDTIPLKIKEWEDLLNKIEQEKKDG